MKDLCAQGTTILQFGLLLNFSEKLVHGVTTRWAMEEIQLDLNYRTPDVCNFDVSDNRFRVSKILGVKNTDIVVPAFCHSDNVEVIRRRHSGMGAFNYESGIPDCDSLITNTKNLPLMVLSGDCPSVILYDRINHAVGLVHSGKKGTINEIVPKTIRKMKDVFGTNPVKLLACIGPKISGYVYEVDEETINIFSSMYPDKKSGVVVKSFNGKPSICLETAIRLQMIKEGVLPLSIEVSGYCTFLDCFENGGDMFFSHRKEKEKAGRFGTIVMLK